MSSVKDTELREEEEEEEEDEDEMKDPLVNVQEY